MKTNEQMIKEVTQQVADRKREQKKRGIRYVSVMLTVLLLAAVLIPAVSASRRFGVIDLMRDPESHIHTASPPEEVEALRAEIEASADPFSHADPKMGVLLDHETAAPCGEVCESNGLTFTLVEIVNGKAIVSERISGSIAEGDITIQDTVEEKIFAVIEVRRTDGLPLTEEEDAYFFRYYRLVSGYNPWQINLCLEAEPYLVNLSYRDAYCQYLLVDVSDMLIFADRTLALALTHFSVGGLDSDVFKADKEGNFAFREEKLTSPHALFYLDLPASYADPAAAKAYEKEHSISKNLKNYK